jgi:hypothetical protein
MLSAMMIHVQKAPEERIGLAPCTFYVFDRVIPAYQRWQRGQ